uniref:Uncharacterized protein n=1 Tax=Timema tahoe TaxID=61484 RepID=A0A7R9ILE6_9NEOP|nr:unnamed protein product [Timema tahoe]
MIKVLLVTCLVGLSLGDFPKARLVFHDPAVYTNTFLAGRYDGNEFYFVTHPVYLDAVIVGTRALMEGQEDPYDEDFFIQVEEVDDLGDYGYRKEVGFGRFTGTVNPGESITVPITSLDDPSQPIVAVPEINGTVIHYVVYSNFGKMFGRYPEFTDRDIGFFDILGNRTNTYGTIVGIEYSKI